jgi:hypothetical protein
LQVSFASISSCCLRRRTYPALGYLAPVYVAGRTMIEEVTGRHLASDIDRHRIAFPVFDQGLLAKISVPELLDEFVAAKLEKLHVRFHAPIERHRDAPWPREDLGRWVDATQAMPDDKKISDPLLWLTFGPPMWL